MYPYFFDLKWQIWAILRIEFAMFTVHIIINGKAGNSTSSNLYSSSAEAFFDLKTMSLVFQTKQM